MTKEQFIQFKEDLKKDIEITRIYKKYIKAWWNAGFKSEDEYNKSYEADRLKIGELRSTMYKKIDCEYSQTHVAYYCAKHRLQGIDKYNYCKDFFNSMKEEKRTAWPLNGSFQEYIKRVDDILNFYETFVCTN